MNNQKRWTIIVLVTGLLCGFALSKAIDIKLSIHPKLKSIIKHIYRIPFKSKPLSKITPQLCDFENKSIVAKLEASKVKISLSQQYVSEGKSSLKCIFQDGGGAVGFYDTLPRNWKGYDTLKFDVYSEEDGIPLSLFIADANHASYGERYNRDRIALNKGWNSIEIPLANVNKKISLDDIAHLRIFLWQVAGTHILYFDNMRLTKEGAGGSDAVIGPVSITIFPQKEKGMVSRLLYGTNLCAKMETDKKIFDFVKNTGITCFRFPGGGSPGWHWDTGIADFSQKMKDMPLANLRYLVAFCKVTNTKLIMQVNIESGTPQEAAALVEFLNKKSDFKVDYWELGNEVYGNWDKGYTTPEKYAELIKQYSLAMKAVDPTIKIGADWGERYYDRVKWDETIIKNAGDSIDFVSVHWYPNHINKEHEFNGRTHPTPEEVTGNAMEIPNIAKRFNSIIEKYAPQRKGKIELTFLEWDGAWDAPSNDPTPPYAQGIVQWSLANAIFYADCLGLFAENGVTVSTQYSLQECMFGLIRGWDPAEGWGGQEWDTETIRPKAFAIQLFSKHFGNILIEKKIEGVTYFDKSEDWWPSSYSGRVPYVTCYTSKFKPGSKLGIILVNKHPERDFDINILIDSAVKVGDTGAVWVLTGPSIMSQNDGKPGTVSIKKALVSNVGNHFKFKMPAHSIVAMELEVTNE